MGNFLISSSIGKKLVMSISGCFLLLFLTFHMVMNATAIFSPEAYNMICEFLGANWYAVAGTVVLALGVVVHFVYALVLTFQNWKARGGVKRYAVTKKEESVSWSSKNMFVLGCIIVAGLIVHLYNFWYNMMFVEFAGQHSNMFGLVPTDGAGLIMIHFANIIWVLVYLVWFVAIWFHLTHGMWSMMQTVGWNNKIWLKRLKVIANIFSTLLMLGFAATVIVYYLKSMGFDFFGLLTW